MNTAGAVEIAASTGIPLPTNASPVVSGGKVYLTGGTFNDGGFLAVYDMNLTELYNPEVCRGSKYTNLNHIL